jgi:hypothetical protein
MTLKRTEWIRSGRKVACKLTNEQVREIRVSEEPSRSLAARMGVSKRHVNRIKAGTRGSSAGHG